MRKWTMGVLAFLVAGTLMLSVLPARAGTNSPYLDQLELNQQQRLSQGVQSGQLTPREFNRLERRQASIRAQEARMKADGNFTPRERAVINQRLNRASAGIYRAKHNNQRVNP